MRRKRSCAVIRVVRKIHFHYTKKRFQDLAIKFNNILTGNQRQNQNGFRPGGVGGGAMERRGLLDIHKDDDDEQDLSFVGSGGSSGPDYEMRSMAAGGAKKHVQDCLRCSKSRRSRERKPR